MELICQRWFFVEGVVRKFTKQQHHVPIVEQYMVQARAGLLLLYLLFSLVGLVFTSFTLARPCRVFST